jgi:predicted PurR-regulated permease PerM
MLGLDPRAVRITWSVLATIGCVAAIYAARRTVIIFLMAIFFAYVLAPVVSAIKVAAKGRLNRAFALTLVYIVLITVVVLGAAAIGETAAKQASILVQQLPTLDKTAGNLSNLPLPLWLEPMRGQLLDAIQQQLTLALEKSLPALRGTVSTVLETLGSIGFALLVPILSFFFVKDGEAMRDSIIALVNKGDRREFAEGLLDDVHQMLGRYIRAVFLLSLSAFIAYLLFFQAMAVPYGALLAIIGGALEFIPVLGPLATAVVTCVVALISGYDSVSWMVVFLIAFRVFQDYVVSPFLMSGGVALHPLLIIFGVLFGEQIGGILGVFFSIPLLATLRLIYVRSTRPVEP